jgi:hypothetical protein
MLTPVGVEKLYARTEVELGVSVLPSRSFLGGENRWGWGLTEEAN